MRKSILCLAAALMLFSCNKAIDSFIEKQVSSATSNSFVKYTIKQGQHIADKSAYRNIDANELNFLVRFDSTAIYRTQSAENQYDINKLYGFSDNGADHHQFSARFGWRWSNDALRLFAYTYNNGEMSSKELTTIPIGAEVKCSIKVAGNSYTFIVNDITETMQRTSTLPSAKGYQLYPYFGGDETAPHDVHIWIKNL
ncbi:MAG TPA: hypothetical protein VGD26_12925 [Chitinophagaceae bacterium]